MAGSSGDTRGTLGPVWETFRAIACVVVPASEELDADGWAGFERIVQSALAARPEGIRRRIVLFVRALDAMARLRLGSGLASAEPLAARRFLEGIERSRVSLVRRGFWGVRTLALMGYYGRPEAASEIGYAAHPDGWTARGLSAGAWPTRSGQGTAEPNVMMAGDEGETSTDA